MIKYTIRVGRFGDKKVSEYDKDALIALVDSSVQVLLQILDQNKTIERSQTPSVQLVGRSPSQTILTGPFWMVNTHRVDTTLNRQGMVMVSKAPEAAAWVLYGVNHQFEYLIEECLKFKKAIEENKTPKRGAALITKMGKDVWRIEAVSLTKYCCPHCGVILHPTSLRRHVQSPSCRIRATEQELGSDWVRMGNTLEIDAVVASGIKHETRPTTYTTWVPKWVKQAVEKFKQGDGYANLKLKEYLQKMKEEQ